MNVYLFRYAVGLYAILCAAVGLNLLFLQPISVRSKVRTLVPQGLSETYATAAIESSNNKTESNSSIAPQSEKDQLTKLIEKSLSYPASEALSKKDLILAVQRSLVSKGYVTGGKDGIMNPVTEGAILAFEFDHHLPLTAEATRDLLHRIFEANTITKDVASSPELSIGPKAQKIILSVQQTLIKLGYPIMDEDGNLGSKTVASIRQFEMQQGMQETGRISGELIVRLNRFAQKTTTNDSRLSRSLP